MTTSGSAGNATTTWIYSPTTGHLTRKQYHDGKGPEYTYSPAGRLQTRQWARGRITTYAYTHGLLTAVSYYGTDSLWQTYLTKRSAWIALLEDEEATQEDIDDAQAEMDTAYAANAAAPDTTTPNLTYTHDRLGRVKTVRRSGTDHFTYDYDPDTLRLNTEHQNLDTLARRLHRHYDSLGRPLSLNLTTTASTPVSQYTTGYGYDTAGRLQNVWHHPALHATTKAPTGTPTFTYGYTYTQANPGDLRVGATTGSNLKQDYIPYTVTRGNGPGAPPLIANRTYEATRDVLHKIENTAGGPPVSSFTYTVNDIGQRDSVATSGSAFGIAPSFVPADWTWHYDSLGQVTRADHASTSASDRAYEFDTIGNRVKTASGTLGLPTTPNWTSNALNQYTVANGVALPTTPAPAPFDADGNMTAGPIPGSNGNNPGVQSPANATDITWDAENRLISLKIGTVTYSYTYDHLSRLIARATNSTVNRRYHYDGWNRIAEFSNTALQDTFTWGLDLSGSMQGAGGVGGLLATRWVSSSNTDYFPTYDGNGNVSEYLGNVGNNVVHYEYDPFGTLTRRTGSTSTRFQYRFSTKPRDFNTGLYYYGYRWYDPQTGRWPSRDPIGEEGGLNLYGFVSNRSVVTVDILGLQLPYTDADGNWLYPYGLPDPFRPSHWHNPFTPWSYSREFKDVINTGIMSTEAIYKRTTYSQSESHLKIPIYGTSCCRKYTTRLIYAHDHFREVTHELVLIKTFNFTISQRPERNQLKNASRIADVLDAMGVADVLMDAVELGALATDLLDEFMHGEYLTTTEIKSIDHLWAIRSNKNTVVTRLVGFLTTSQITDCNNDA